MNRTAAVMTAFAVAFAPVRAFAQDAGAATSPDPLPPTAATTGEGPVTAGEPTAATRPLEATTPLRAPPAAPSPVFAGFHEDQFVLSDRRGDFFLVPAGRLQLDPIVYLGDHVLDGSTSGSTYTRPAVTDGLIVRRARLELFGGIAGRFTFQIGSDFFVNTPPTGTDLWIDARVIPLFHVQIGQFDAPFTLDNRTTDKYLDFMERSLIVRGLAIPSNKELGLMLWGEDGSRLVYYSVGVFNGDGMDRINRDDAIDVMARVFSHPLIRTHLPIRDLQIGASVRWGYRDRSVDYAFPAINTPGNVSLFNPVLVGGLQPVVVVPDGAQFAVGGELDLPIGRFDLRGEFVYVAYDTREMAPDTHSGAMPISVAGPSVDARLAGDGVRSGGIHAIGYYAQLGWWPFGHVAVNGRPGYENPPSVHPARPDPAIAQGLQVVARVDALDMRYDGGSRSAMAGQGAPAADGWYDALGLELGVNYWLTRHLRFTSNYLHWIFPDQPANAMSVLAADNHMHGPGPARPGWYGELMFRVALAL